MATTKVTDTHVIIDMPGAFDSFFSLSGVGQGIVGLRESGYPGAPGLYKAYQESTRITRGKGYSLRLTIPRDEHTHDVLDCLRDYADTCAKVNEDNAYGTGLDPADRNDAYGEMMAGRKTRERCDKLLAELGDPK